MYEDDDWDADWPPPMSLGDKLMLAGVGVLGILVFAVLAINLGRGWG